LQVLGAGIHDRVDRFVRTGLADHVADQRTHQLSPDVAGVDHSAGRQLIVSDNDFPRYAECMKNNRDGKTGAVLARCAMNQHGHLTRLEQPEQFRQMRRQHARQTPVYLEHHGLGARKIRAFSQQARHAFVGAHVAGDLKCQLLKFNRQIVGRPLALTLAAQVTYGLYAKGPEGFPALGGKHVQLVGP